MHPPIKQHADEIREKIKGGQLYGLPVDMSDMDMLLCAAYLVGRKEGMEFKDTTLTPSRLIKVLNVVRNQKPSH